MDKFERLNRETRDYNNRNVNRFNDAVPTKCNAGFNYFDYLNNQTFKEKNGEYSNFYF